VNNEHNIEEIFRSTFETFEASVDPSVWSAVQSGIVSKSASAAVAAKTTGGIVKTLIISGATLVTGLGLGYVFFNNNKQTSPPENSKYTLTHDKSEALDENGNVIENTSSSESIKPEPQKMVDVVIPVEDKTTGKKEMVKIRVAEQPYFNKSIAHDELSQTERNLWNRYYEEKTKRENQDENNKQQDKHETEKISQANNATVEELDMDMPVALINASKQAGTLPLLINFTNSTEEENYHWDFGDGNTSVNPNPEHIYREAGTYTVKLVVKNKAGKTSADKMIIEVTAPASFSKIPNVFSPNNDGINDTYIVIGNHIKLFTMSVFNRNGELLYRTNDMNAGWNGEDLKGNSMPEGTYLVVLEALGADNTRIREAQAITLER
jgi:gliding motility-associated-like protein